MTPAPDPDLIPQAGQSSPVIPQAGQSSPVIPEAGQSSPVIPEAGQSSPVIPEAGQSSPVIPQAGQSSPVIPQAGQSSPVIPQARQRLSGSPVPDEKHDRRAPLVLTLALIGVSFSGPLVRLSHANPLAIAAWRLGFSLIVIALALVITGEWRQWARITRRELAIAVGAGAMLAFHFWSWNASIAYTSVAASVVLVNTQPVVVALLSTFWLRERPSGRQWLGIAIAMLGALIVALPDFRATDAAAHPQAFLGDMLALLGALTASIYFVSGRRLRATLDLWPYVGLVYGSCFVVLLLLVAMTGAPLAPQPPREIGIFVALALGPMLLGHTGLNWALKHSPAYVVNLTLLGEPVGATIIAALLPGIREVPGVLTLVGGGVVLAGILLAARGAEAAVQSTVQGTA